MLHVWYLDHINIFCEQNNTYSCLTLSKLDVSVSYVLTLTNTEWHSVKSATTFSHVKLNVFLISECPRTFYGHDFQLNWVLVNPEDHYEWTGTITNCDLSSSLMQSQRKFLYLLAMATDCLIVAIYRSNCCCTAHKFHINNIQYFTGKNKLEFNETITVYGFKFCSSRIIHWFSVVQGSIWVCFGCFTTGN